MPSLINKDSNSLIKMSTKIYYEFKKDQIASYKEALIKKTENHHVFYFEFTKKLKGYYVLENDKIWLSVCVITRFFRMKTYEKFYCKYFDINEKDQKAFYVYDFTSDWKNWEAITKDQKTLLAIIESNTRQGTPRKSLMTIDKERFNIQFKTVNRNNMEI